VHKVSLCKVADCIYPTTEQMIRDQELGFRNVLNGNIT